MASLTLTAAPEYLFAHPSIANVLDGTPKPFQRLILVRPTMILRFGSWTMRLTNIHTARQSTSTSTTRSSMITILHMMMVSHARFMNTEQ